MTLKTEQKQIWIKQQQKWHGVPQYPLKQNLNLLSNEKYIAEQV